MTATNDRPALSSETAPHIEKKPELFDSNKNLGLEARKGLDTKIDWLTDRKVVK
jgi:hypothetical protein